MQWANFSLLLHLREKDTSSKLLHESSPIPTLPNSNTKIMEKITFFPLFLTEKATKGIPMKRTKKVQNENKEKVDLKKTKGKEKANEK